MLRLIFRCAFAVLCLAAACLPIGANPNEKSATGFSGRPKQWEGKALVELPLSDWERKFNRSFPGEIAKFTDGEREFFFRWTNQGTRRVHSSSECFRGLGYAVVSRGVILDGKGARWSSYDAQRGDRQLLIRERISDEQGNEWSDFSAWYWSTLLGTTNGPWLAVTVVDRALRARFTCCSLTLSHVGRVSVHPGHAEACPSGGTRFRASSFF